MNLGVVDNLAWRFSTDIQYTIILKDLVYSGINFNCKILQ